MTGPEQTHRFQDLRLRDALAEQARQDLPRPAGLMNTKGQRVDTGDPEKFWVIDADADVWIVESRGVDKGKAIGVTVGVVVVAAIVGVVIWIVKATSGPDYSVLRTTPDVDGTTVVYVRSDDSMDDKDYEKITGDMWVKYDKVHVNFSCSTGKQRGITSQSGALNYTGRRFPAWSNC